MGVNDRRFFACPAVIPREVEMACLQALSCIDPAVSRFDPARELASVGIIAAFAHGSSRGRARLNRRCRELPRVDGAGNQLNEVGCCIEGGRVASPFDFANCRGRDRRGKGTDETDHAVRASRAVAADDRHLHGRELRGGWIGADRVAEVGQGCPGVVPADLPPLLGERVPGASTVTVGVGGAK